MVLCQLLITDPSIKSYVINSFGRKRVQILKLDYRYTAGGADKIIVLQSSNLRLPLSNYPYFAFSPNNAHQIGNLHGDIVFDDVTFDGNLELNILDYDTGAAPANFTTMIITLDITDY